MSTPFDPSAPAAPGSGLFGLSTPLEAAAAVAIPVPFDVTASYRKGAAHGPAAILRASHQIELSDMVFGSPHARGICMLEANPSIAVLNEEGRRLADPILALGGEVDRDAALRADRERVNAIGAELNDIVEDEVAAVLDRGQLPCVVGGDHSIPLGAFRAAAARHPGLGLLHFDAHADLRPAYGGFTFSHASILYNAITELDAIAQLVQIGLRDPGEEELEQMAAHEGRVRVLYDHQWATAKLEHQDLRALVRATVAQLPQEIWITFDVDGLDPALCPNTGTPVPGGLSWHETALWLSEVALSGKRVVGLDLVEVAPDPDANERDSLDAIVGARLLYRLIATALRTRE